MPGPVQARHQLSQMAPLLPTGTGSSERSGAVGFGQHFGQRFGPHGPDHFSPAPQPPQPPQGVWARTKATVGRFFGWLKGLVLNKWVLGIGATLGGLVVASRFIKPHAAFEGIDTWQYDAQKDCWLGRSEAEVKGYFKQMAVAKKTGEGAKYAVTRYAYKDNEGGDMAYTRTEYDGQKNPLLDWSDLPKDLRAQITKGG